MESAAEHEEEPKAPERSASQKSLPETTPVPDDEEEEEEDEPPLNMMSFIKTVTQQWPQELSEECRALPRNLQKCWDRLHLEEHLQKVNPCKACAQDVKPVVEGSVVGEEAV